jgi:hypothetical protein
MNNYLLVNGDEKNKEYSHCVLVRGENDKCGEHGRFYKKKYIRKTKL